MMTMRFKFKRDEKLRFISHLDQQCLFQRAFRRAEIPMAYSAGYNPHPKLAFSGAMALGMTSEEEYADIGLTEEVTPDDFVEKMNYSLPDGISILEAWEVDNKVPSLMSSVEKSVYQISFYDEDINFNEKDLNEIIDAFLDQKIITVQKRNKKGRLKETNIRPFIDELSFIEQNEDTLVFGLSLKYIEQKCVKPILVMKELNEFGGLNLTVDETMGIHKTQQILRKIED